MKVFNDKMVTILDPTLISTLERIRRSRNFNPKKYIDRKKKLLNNYMKKHQLRSCVIGLSGGVDSAVVLGIIKEASKVQNSPIEKIVPVILPVNLKKYATNQNDAINKAKRLCKSLEIDSFVIDLSASFMILKKATDKSLKITGDDWSGGQLVSYLRTPALYYITSLLVQKNSPGIVCGTTNRDEGAYLGFFGKSGDGMVDIQLISDLHKSEVYETAKLLKIPNIITVSPPTGDMYDGRVDEEVFGVPYDFVELYLSFLTLNDSKKKQLISKWSEKTYRQFKICQNKLEKLHRYNSHKYIGKSPSIHFDVMERTVPGGWL